MTAAASTSAGMPAASQRSPSGSDDGPDVFTRAFEALIVLEFAVFVALFAALIVLALA